MREENGIVVDHHEDVVKVLLLGLNFPIVEGDRCEWSNELNIHGVVMSILGSNSKLEGVETEENGTEGNDCWDKVFLSVVILSYKVEACSSPNTEHNDLVENDSSVN